MDKQTPILVTGGSGAVGRYVVDDLLQHGYRVGVLDRVEPTSWTWTR